MILRNNTSEGENMVFSDRTIVSGELKSMKKGERRNNPPFTPVLLLCSELSSHFLIKLLHYGAGCIFYLFGSKSLLL